MDSREHRHPASLLLQGQGLLIAVVVRSLLLLLGFVLCGGSGVASLHAEGTYTAAHRDLNEPNDPYDSKGPYAAWDHTLTPPAIAPFTPIEPFEATYQFGWEGVSAGGASIRVSAGNNPSGKRDHSSRLISAEGGPNEWVRKLWNYHADYQGEAGVNGEVPSWFHMDESVSRGMMVSDAVFTRDAVFACHRFTTESKPWLYTPLPGVRDLFAAMLFVRSQPLRDGDHLRLSTFPDRNPYLVDLTVAGRDTLEIMGKKVPAIRFTIGIQTIETMGPDIGKLAPHRKFRSGRVWMSDDSRRIPLKAEVDVFIGSVFAKLVQMNPAL